MGSACIPSLDEGLWYVARVCFIEFDIYYSLERIFDLPLSFASEYVSHQIELETHFDHERENTERIRNFVLNDPPKNLRGGVAYVPAVHAAFCTPRLLVMEYIDGAVKMTDVEGMERKLGLNTIKVMNSVCEVFAAQVFRWGFVNADPHVSNSHSAVRFYHLVSAQFLITVS